MVKINVTYEAAKNLYTCDYEHVEATAELLVDYHVACSLEWSGFGRCVADTDLSSLELLLGQLENLRRRTYLPGSVKNVKIMEGESND